MRRRRHAACGACPCAISCLRAGAVSEDVRVWEGTRESGRTEAEGGLEDGDGDAVEHGGPGCADGVREGDEHGPGARGACAAASSEQAGEQASAG